MSIPGQLDKKTAHFQPTTVVSNVENEKMLQLLSDLEDSKTVNFAYHTDDSNVGMELSRDNTDINYLAETLACS